MQSTVPSKQITSLPLHSHGWLCHRHGNNSPHQPTSPQLTTGSNISVVAQCPLCVQSRHLCQNHISDQSYRPKSTWKYFLFYLRFSPCTLHCSFYFLLRILSLFHWYVAGKSKNRNFSEKQSLGRGWEQNVISLAGVDQSRHLYCHRNLFSNTFSCDG